MPHLSSEKKAPDPSFPTLTTSGSWLAAPEKALLCHPQGGTLLKSHQGMASGDVLEKSLVRQENVTWTVAPAPAPAPGTRQPAALCSLAWHPFSVGGTQDSLSAGQQLPAFSAGLF